MPRLSRAESMALTRERLLESALTLYVSRGYAGVTIEKIAEDGGFSRGAFYAHFPSKEAIYLELLRERAGALLPGFLKPISDATSSREAIDAICAWVDRRLLATDLSYLFVEVLQHAKKGGGLTAEQMEPIRDRWRQIGEALMRFIPKGTRPANPADLGAIILLQIADGPFIEEAGGPRPSHLLRITLTALLR